MNPYQPMMPFNMGTWPGMGQQAGAPQGPGEDEQLRALLDAVRTGTFNGRPMMEGAPAPAQGVPPPGLPGQIQQVTGAPPPASPYDVAMGNAPAPETANLQDDKKGGMTPEVRAMLASQLPQFGASLGKMFDVLAGRKPYTLV